MALGNFLRVRKEFAECADDYSQGVNDAEEPAEAQLADLLLPRHLL
jgi:hypothetical protein